MTTRTLARQVLDRFNLRECLLSSAYSRGFLSDVQELMGADRSLEEAHAEKRQVDLLLAYGYGQQPMRDKPFAYADGIAIIPVHGTLINRFACSWGFITGYNFVLAQMNAALEDDDVKVIVFDVNSNGGDAVGCFELCQKIYDARGVKPLLALVDSNALSAAYAIASSCDKVYVTPSGWAGSIGAVTLHFDISQALKLEGVVVTVIADDPHKADGNPYEPLPAEVAADIKAQISKRYGEFVEVVARNRGLDSQAIRDMQSRSFRADEALSLQLIDGVQSPSDAVAAFLGELGSDDPEDTEEDDQSMSTAPAPVDQSAVIAAERERIKGIQTCEAAQGREGLASHLALSTALSVDEAKAILGAAPKAAATPPAVVAPAGEAAQAPAATGAAAAAPAPAPAPAPADPFRAAMDAGSSPNVGADASGEGEGAAEGPSRGQKAMLAAFGPPKTEKMNGRAVN